MALMTRERKSSTAALPPSTKMTQILELSDSDSQIKAKAISKRSTCMTRAWAKDNSGVKFQSATWHLLFS